MSPLLFCYLANFAYITARRALDNESTTSGGVAWLAFCPVRRRVAVGGSVLISGMATDITVVLILFQKHCTQ